MRKLLLAGMIVATSLFAQGGNHQDYNSNSYKTINSQKYSLNENQKESLIYMYQEEKLARDVYITLGKKWNLRPFLNIQKAEQVHMNAVKSLLKKYNIPVPVVPDEVGKFNLPELTELYNKLVAKGMKSKKDALEVGKEIEILDIKDLEERMKDATPDMKMVFSRLKAGSEHHLKAFNINLGIS
jgi:hypothetical protein